MVSTTQANVTRLGALEHAAELPAQNTIGTAYDPFGHFYEFSFPSRLALRIECRRMLPTALRTSGGGTE